MPKNSKNCQNAQNVIFLLQRALPQAPFPRQKCTFFVTNAKKMQKLSKCSKCYISSPAGAAAGAFSPAKMYLFGEHLEQLQHKLQKLSKCSKCYISSPAGAAAGAFSPAKMHFFCEKCQKIAKIVKMLKMLYFFSSGRCRRRLFPGKNALFL